MSLITRCPACGTMFRVVPDQLRISEGWVRCGHCAEIFDATAHMAEHAAPAGRDEDLVTQPAEIPTQPPDLDSPDLALPGRKAYAPPGAIPPWPGPPSSARGSGARTGTERAGTPANAVTPKSSVPWPEEDPLVRGADVGLDPA